MDKIRLGLLGCGGMGGTHQSGLAELGDIMDLTVVCDTVPERADLAAARLGARRAVTEDYRDMVDDLDAVLIALPHDLHLEAGLFFLNAGKHVLMEKPLANSESACIQLIEAAEKRKLVLMTAYPVRYWPAIRRMKELVDSGYCGEVFQMSIWTEQYTRYEDGHWALSADRLGGGQFFSHGCHYVDLLLWFLGRPVRGVHLGTRLGTPWMEREGTSNAAITFASGAMGYHFGTWGARGTRLGYSFHIHGTRCMLEYNLAEGKLTAHTHVVDGQANPDPATRTVVLLEDDDRSKKTQHETRHFLDCIRTGSRPLTDGPSSLQGLRLIWRLYDAEQQNAIADLSGLGLDEDWRQERAASGQISRT